MKTQTVTINKTADRPEGVEVELVTPESDLEQRVLAHLLAGFMRDAPAQGRVDDALPEDVRYEYTRNGSFVAMGTPPDEAMSEEMELSSAGPPEAEDAGDNGNDKASGEKADG